MNTMIKTLLMAASFGVAGLQAAASTDTAAEPTLAISASHVLVDGGVVLDDAMVLIADGRILAVAPKAELQDNLPDGVTVVHHDGWMSAGLLRLTARWV